MMYNQLVSSIHFIAVALFLPTLLVCMYADETMTDNITDTGYNTGYKTGTNGMNSNIRGRNALEKHVAFFDR